MIEDQVFSTQIIDNGNLQYRIEVNQPQPGVYRQRHIYTRPNSIIEPWIPSLKCIYHDVRLGGYEVSEVIGAA